MDKLNIKKLNRRRDPNYKNYGPWRVGIHEVTFNSDYQLLDVNAQSIVDDIIEDLKHHPYQGRYHQHPLWQFIDNSDQAVVWSAKIDRNNRLTYMIHKDKNEILIINCYGHQVGQHSYSNPGE